MRFRILLTAILGLLDLGIHGAPASVNESPKQAFVATGSPPEYPEPEVVKYTTHVLPWLQKGLYGDPTTIAKISSALEQCKTQLTTASTSNTNPLSPAAHIFVNRKFLTDGQKKDGTGCAAFLLWFFKTMPKGAHLHIHFNAILPFLDAWGLAFTDAKKFKDPFYQYEIPPGFTESILVVGSESVMKQGKRVAKKGAKSMEFGPLTSANEERLKREFGQQQLFPPNVKEYVPLHLPWE
jgi:hypothetical protein